MKNIPAPTRKRLVVLSQLLAQRIALGEERITSAEIAALTGWGEATARRDIAAAGGANGGRGGYDARLLRSAVESALGISGAARPRKCCIVGLGRLGSILLESPGLGGTAFVLAAGFDSSPNRTEILRSEIPLYPTTQLESVVKSQGIEFALLAVPGNAAQKAAERLAACGIRGIVNYTDTVLAVPEGVAVENVSPATALANLAAKL